SRRVACHIPGAAALRIAFDVCAIATGKSAHNQSDRYGNYNSEHCHHSSGDELALKRVHDAVAEEGDHHGLWQHTNSQANNVGPEVCAHGAEGHVGDDERAGWNEAHSEAGEQCVLTHEARE